MIATTAHDDRPAGGSDTWHDVGAAMIEALGVGEDHRHLDVAGGTGTPCPSLMAASTRPATGSA